jgi:DNA-binding beta-propeller fold protein YncE
MRKLIQSRNFLIGSAFAVALAGLGVAQFALQGKAEAQGVMAPKFEVDPYWPKPLPNHWVMGMAIGVWVDNNDHIWMVHRAGTVDRTISQLSRNQGECCQAAPPVLSFDEAGNVLHSWGGPGEGYQWPDSNHGIFVDYKGNVWIGGNGGPDSQILKFTQDGKFLMQIGKSGARAKAGAAADANAEASEEGFAANSNDPNNFGRVAKIFVDAKANEAYVADGYLNHRVAVLDADTGKMKRWWGAYGQNPVDDTVLPRYTPDLQHDRAHEPNFRNPVHCADMSVDRLIYVCDRVNDRMQVFTPEGKFVKEMYYKTATLTDGSVWDIAFSKDPQQKYIFMADGVNEHVVILDRQTLTPIYTFGDGGNSAGEFHGVHSIAIDSKGNLFTTETYEGRRIQKFLYKGMGPVTKMDEGVAWPKS